MSRTYLQHCLKDDILCRWPDNAMPLYVYIAPFQWYEKKKQQESLVYRQLVLDALETWRQVSNNLVRFQIVDNLNQSQIDFKWRRVDRRTLGHCTYEIDAQNRIFSAEIQIGISDGLIHAAYQDAEEVQHTVLHEIGHALGLLGHSDHSADIMYVPHQYGVHSLSSRDAETLRWLYQLPVGFNYKAIGKKYSLKTGFTLNDVIEKIEQRLQGSFEDSPSSEEEESAQSFPIGLHALEAHHEILSTMGQFYIQTQNIQINQEKQAQLKKIISEKKRQHRLPPWT